MPKTKAIKTNKPASEQPSTYTTMYRILTAPVNLYTNVKDSLRTINKKAPSKDEMQKSQSMIKELLIKMHVNFEIQRQVLENVQNAKTLEELIRARKILKVLHDNGLSGAAADQFFLGGHFRIRDGGKLFAQLNAIKGSEPRFSSHFPKSRIEEKGISAGRIFPEVLFLKTLEGDKIYSHFQAEASPWRQVASGGLTNYVPNLQTLQTMEHIYDSAIYFSAKKIAEYRGQTVHNRSNYGWSPFADNNPITSMKTLPRQSQQQSCSMESEKEVIPSSAAIMVL